MLFWWAKRLASENREEAREGFLFVASVGTETKNSAGLFLFVTQVGVDVKNAMQGRFLRPLKSEMREKKQRRLDAFGR